MKTENRHINIQEPEGMMLLRYIKDTASNEENLILKLGWKRMKIIRGSYYRPPVYIMRTMRWNGSLAEIH